jgi:uncharacterized damage-inducible protein DinB
VTTLDVMKEDQRTHPPVDGPEAEMLVGFLDYQRDALLWKLDGLDDEQLRRPHEPSGLTLLGLVKHLTDVERSWFRENFAGEDLAHLWDDADPDRYWRIEPGETAGGLVADYREECRRANGIIRASSLDTPLAKPSPGRTPPTLRWVCLHMIEETARHLGHADLIREAIDGATGE